MAGPGTPSTDPNTQALMHALTEAGVEPEDAHNATQAVANMAGRAITAALEAHKGEIVARIDAHKAEIVARIDAQNAKFEAQFDAQDAKLSALRWMIGIGFPLLAVLIALIRLLG